MSDNDVTARANGKSGDKAGDASAKGSVPGVPGVPTHIAIIMDGNGRWAEERGMERIEGHRAGAKTVREITTYCRELGVRYLTLYAFSSENWGRPEPEVGGLMQLLADYLGDERTTLLKNQIE